MALGPTLMLLAGLAAAETPAKPADLFQLTKIWTVKLTFTPEQWAAMEPKGAAGGPFGGPGGPRRFGPSMLLAPALLKRGDRDGDGKLSADELRGLGDRLFTEWDKDGAGKLDAEKVRAGLTSILEMPRPPGGGPPGGGPRGGGFLGPEGGRNGMSAASGIVFEYVHARLEIDGRAFDDVAVRYKGNGTFRQARGLLKRSLKLDLDEYQKGQKLAGVTKLNLHNEIADPSWMNEALAYRFFRDAGVPAPRTAYARVYVTVPGKFERKYFGLYALVENIDRNFAESAFGTRKGALFKPVAPDLFQDRGDDWARYNQAYDPKTELDDAQKRRVIELARLVSHASDAEFAAALPRYLDVPEFAAFMAATVALSNRDSLLDMNQNYAVHLDPKSGRFQFVPWDLDHSFGQFGMGGASAATMSIERPWQGDKRFLERVFAVPAFKRLYLAKLKELQRTLLTPARLDGQVDELARAIRPAVADESPDKLARFDTAVAGKVVDLDPALGNLAAQATPIKPFVAARARSLADQLAGKAPPDQGQGFGFGRGPGGFGGGGRGPGGFLGGALLNALDRDKDGALTRAELTEGLARWAPSAPLGDQELRASIDKAVGFPR